MTNPALVVVDMLYDFIDGSLACQNAENAVKAACRFIASRTGKGSGDESEILDTFPVLFVRDRHPSDHSSFKENGGIWPAHCVAGTRGGEIHADLCGYANEELIFDKGCDKEVEQYSGFDGRNSAGQSLGEILGLLDAEDVYVCGIATEYCVRNTCEDLVKAGFRVHLLQDCLAYVDRQGHEDAMKEMASEGISICSFH
ncbi:MAG: isochorismatase family protein [Bacteroidales bacterium]|nr:isochorismatase family protein [Bacteroidales bacterium]